MLLELSSDALAGGARPSMQVAPFACQFTVRPPRLHHLMRIRGREWTKCVHFHNSVLSPALSSSAC
jgi:hypothetical protein